MTGKQRLENLDKKQPPAHSGKVTVLGKEQAAWPVSLLKFQPTSPQDLPGKAGATSLSSNLGPAKRTMHTIDYLPAIDGFHVVFYGSAGPVVEIVPMHRVNAWSPFPAGESYQVPGEV